MAALQLNNALSSYEDRLDWANKEIERIGERNLTIYQLDKISTYLIEGTNLETRGEIITANRLVTVNKRETSREGLMEKLEGGESAFHQLIKEDKNVILTPKVEITEKDIEEVPGLRQLREEINRLEQKIVDEPDMPLKLRGKIKQTIIEMRRDQYVLKNSFRQPMFSRGTTASNILTNFDYDISLQDPGQVLSLLVNYSKLKIEFRDDNTADLKWILHDLDAITMEALENKPTLSYILAQKILGCTNNEIREGLIEEYGVDHTQEYISSLYRNKIPQIIAEKATEKWIDYVYMNKIKGVYKRCSRCKEIKLANNRNFSINRTSSSKFYSICKSCRNKKK